MLRHSGLTGWQWDAGRAAGLIGSSDVDGRRWSAAIANDVIARRDEIIAIVGAEAPIGGHKAAARLAERSGLAVEKPDVEALADAGLLATAGWYKEWPLWDCRALDAVDVGLLSAIVAERQAWIAGSISKWDARVTSGGGAVSLPGSPSSAVLRLGGWTATPKPTWMRSPPTRTWPSRSGWTGC